MSYSSEKKKKLNDTYILNDTYTKTPTAAPQHTHLSSHTPSHTSSHTPSEAASHTTTVFRITNSSFFDVWSRSTMSGKKKNLSN